MKDIRIFIIWFYLAVFINTASYAQIFDFDSLYHNNSVYKETIDSIYNFIDIFEVDEVMKISIESDFKNLMKNKLKDDYQPAVLSYMVSDSVLVNRHIEIKPRGNIRRHSCYYPPLMLNFPKKKAVLNLFKKTDKIKMVVKCDKNRINEQYLL